MTSTSAPSRADLLDALKTSEAEFVDQLNAYPVGKLEEGRYENGWNAREILAHVASIEWTYTKLFDIARQPPSTTEEQQPPTKSAKGGISSYNDRQVAKRAEASIEDLLEEFQRNRAVTINAVEEAEDEILLKEIKSTGGFVGPLSQVLQWVAVDHLRMHLNDITKGSSV